MNKTTQSRLFLIVLFAVFFVPLLFALWLYYGSDQAHTVNMQNHGELIQPPRSLKNFSITGEKNYLLSNKDIEGKWTLLYLGNEKCNLYCEADLFKMRQVRLTLGRDSQRVQRIYVALTDKIDLVENNSVFNKHEDMQTTVINKTQFYNHLPQFKDMQEHRVYLIDPLGNLMMYYPNNATAKGMKKDLKRLLKVSKIG